MFILIPISVEIEVLLNIVTKFGVTGWTRLDLDCSWGYFQQSFETIQGGMDGVKVKLGVLGGFGSFPVVFPGLGWFWLVSVFSGIP